MAIKTKKTGTYKPSTSTTPTQGTSSAANKALQQSLNAKGANLAVDGKYGPLTAAAVAKYGSSSGSSTDSGSPKIGDIYNIGGVDPNIESAGNALDQYNTNKANGVSNVNENSIRNNILGNFQAEIDATNALYANKLNQAKIAGAGRIGSSTAIQSRRGLLGSDMGATYTTDVNNANEEVYNSIEAEKAAAVAGILEKARTSADNLIKEKNTAIGEGLDSHLTYLKNMTAYKEANAIKAAQSIYDQNFTPENLTADQLKKTAEGYGVKPEDIKSAFITVKKTGDEARAKKEAEDLKNKLSGMKVIPTGSVLVDANGKVIAQGNKKTTGGGGGTIKPFVSGAATFTPEDISDLSNGLEASRGVDKYVDPDVYLNSYTRWTNLGGLAKDFLTKYPPTKYVNPTNTTLPDYLRSKKTSTKSTKDSNAINPDTGLPNWLTE